MEKNVIFLANSVANTDRRLETLNGRVERWVQAVDLITSAEENGEIVPVEEEEAVMELLDEVTQVKEDYLQLKTDISEIQQLQKELSLSLRRQLIQVHARYGCLRSKIGPKLPNGLQMRSNCDKPSPIRPPRPPPRKR